MQNLQLYKNKKKLLKLTNQKISEIAGIPLRTVEDFFRGASENPRIDTVQAIEFALNIKKHNPEMLEEVVFNDDSLIPLLGSVVAGVPIESQEDLECYISYNQRPAEEYFALRVHGDSMKNIGIQDKSIIICHKQETAENGEIVVAMLNKEQTVKRYKIHNDSIFLMPENPDYLPIPITPKDELLILGKVVEVRITL